MTNITPLFPDEGSGASSQAGPELDLSDQRISCLACGGKLIDSEIYRRYLVCPRCRFHYSMAARRRVDTLADAGTFKETNRWIRSLDPLSFSPRVSYRVRLLRDQVRTGLTEAAVTGSCTIGGTSAVLIVLDFGFLGGSMGLVVGEKVALALELAARKRHAAVAVITSGGARIQEGVLSLMQMAKTTVAVNALHDRGVPLIVALANPSTGQVYASFASLADIIFAEPGAHIGFAPFRAVQAVAERKLASEQYTAEHYVKHGIIDDVVDREHLKSTVSTVLDLLNPDFSLSASRRRRPYVPPPRELPAWEMVQLARRPDRPRARYYINEIFANFAALHGDRLHADDPSVITGIARLAGQTVVVIGQNKEPPAALEDGGQDAPDNLRAISGEAPARAVGRIQPEGFRKAQRAIRFAGRFKLPLITLIDTPGAETDLAAEQRGLGGAIATTISEYARVMAPSISVLIGEGGSEAALAFGVSDRVLMLQNAIYSPISPEGGAEAEMRDAGKADVMAKALKLTSTDCLQMGIIDQVVAEPEGGAHSHPAEAARLLRRALMHELIDVMNVYPRTLVRRRQKKFRNMGEYGSRFRDALTRELTIFQAAFSATMRALRKPGGDEPEDTVARAAGEDGEGAPPGS